MVQGRQKHLNCKVMGNASLTGTLLDHHTALWSIVRLHVVMVKIDKIVILQSILRKKPPLNLLLLYLLLGVHVGSFTKWINPVR